MIELREYVDELGRSRFARWMESIKDDSTIARINRALGGLSLGNTSNLKSVGSGVSELKIHFGPGVRVYLGNDGEHLVLLLGGGSKRTQEQDIERAKAAWQAYKRRKTAGDL